MSQAGSITLGGHELTEIPLSQLAAQISYVSQDNYLFNRSIRENIRMGKPMLPMRKWNRRQSEVAATASFMVWIKVMKRLSAAAVPSFLVVNASVSLLPALC